MAAVINTNYLSLVARNNLNKSQSALGAAIERLSSGLRINSAKDDAAGQAIANRFTTNVRGLTQAARNANDGISIAQTTEGALNEVNANLQRIRELAVQAANGSNSAGDLRSIQAEVNQRLEEISRISAQTQSNGVNVLAADNPLTIQVGANDKETLVIDLKQIDANSLDMAQFSIAGPHGAIPTFPIFPVAMLAEDFFQSIKDANGAVIATGNISVEYKLDGGATQIAAVGDLTKDSKGNFFIKIDQADAGPGALADKYYAVEAKNFKITTDANPTQSTAVATIAIRTSDLAYAATDGALAVVDAALSRIDSLRGDLGAIQNRFESTIANLNNAVNNLSAARSRIEDADYATEVSNMTKNQILQQAGASVLAQANQVPRMVVSLLR